MAGPSHAEMLQLAALLEGSPQVGGSQYGGLKFGGQKHGGGLFGGGLYGGGKYGASAPQSVNVPATAPQLPPFEQPGGMARYMPPMAQPPVQMPPVNVTAQAPQGAPPAVPPMPPPPQVNSAPSSSVIDDVLKAVIQNGGKIPPQFAEMFPQWAGGSLTQQGGG